MAQVFFKNSGKGIPVNTIFCIGRNYAKHAEELNNPIPESPIIFIKPGTTLVQDGGFIDLPAMSNEVHYETEVVALIGRSGKNISVEEALAYVRGYGIGIDVTARDIQERAKQKSHPWTIAKGFDTFAPISAFVNAAQIPDPQNIHFKLEINGKIRQNGNTKMMLVPVAQLISFLSSIFTLTPGDLVFSGTPEGVGRLHEGDVLAATLGDGLTSLTVQVRKAQHD